MAKSKFLTAQWVNLLNLTYAIDPQLLEPHVPPGVDLDIQDGKAFVSLVAFDFLDTKVKGIKLPFHVNFPEINLRYYLKYKGKNGVAFIKEFVPKFCIAFVADKIYNEPYESIPMRSHTQVEGDLMKIVHEFEKGGKTHKIEIEAGTTTRMPEPDSPEHYFKEHDVGFGVTKKGKTLWYEVEHPWWEIYDLKSWKLDVDFGILYGEKWAFLKDEEPKYGLLAKGSEIAVYSSLDLHTLDNFKSKTH